MPDRKQKILAIDDDANWLQLVKVNLETDGYEVTLSSDGNDGLQKALSILPDLILLDLNMEVMDGFEMLKKLRDDEHGKNMPVVILTNLNSGPSVTECLNYKVAGYAVKSNTSLAELGKMIKTII
jgi:CheY-like chemotaxis protein